MSELEQYDDKYFIELAIKYPNETPESLGEKIARGVKAKELFDKQFSKNKGGKRGKIVLSTNILTIKDKIKGIEPNDALQEDKIICLFCGKEFKALSNNHLASHGHTRESYRKLFGYDSVDSLTIKKLLDKRKEQVIVAQSKRKKKS